VSPSPLRYVLDTNVCLDLFVFGDAQCASLLAAVHAGQIELVTCDDCRAEWQSVLTYPQLKLSAEQRARAMQAFDACVRCLQGADLAVRSEAVLPRCSDRDDQKFLELAQQSGAQALLTRDDALLRLARRTKRDGLFAILPPALWQEAISGR
jgi:putative PIN family toxin of toxin-antitoxin system